MNNPTRYEVMAAIDARHIEIESLTKIIAEMELKIKKLNQRKQDLRNLNSLDIVLLRELQDGTD